MRWPALLFLASGAALAAPPAWATPSIELGSAASWRWFGDNVALEDAIFASVRLGIRTGPRFTLWTDLAHGEPEGKYSRTRSFVSGLRVLAQIGLRAEGDVRPYLIGGAGALYFDFGDRTDAAFGTLTGGAGLEFQVGARTSLFAEGTVDVFWADETRYDALGRPLYGVRRYSESIPGVSAGLELDF